MNYSKWLIIVIGVIFFGCGVWVGRSVASVEKEDHEKTAYSEEEKTCINKELPQTVNEELSEEENRFLEEHLYGQWKFSERVIKIEENVHDTKISSNISDEGVKELKERGGALLRYEETKVCLGEGLDHVLSNAGDMFLFASYGCFNQTDNPVYKVSRLNTDILTLKDIYEKEQGYEVQVEGIEDFIHIGYSGSITDTKEVIENENVFFDCFGSDIYIDPDDADTIYIDFCGLWKMERENINNDTNGKWYGKG